MGMHQASQRQLKVAAEIRQVLATIVQRVPAPDILLEDIHLTITEVQISPDLKHAKIYVMPLKKNKEAIISLLNKKSFFYRGKIARELTLKFTPSLYFILDETFDRVARIDFLLKSSQRPYKDQGA